MAMAKEMRQISETTSNPSNGYLQNPMIMYLKITMKSQHWIP